MGTVIHLKSQINNSYFDLKDSVENKLILVEEKIKNKLTSEVDLVQKMSDYHIKTGGKRLRALLTLGSSKLCGYLKGGRDINFAACIELIHGATLLHDDVIDNGSIRRGKKTANFIWGNHSSILTGDYLLSRCFEMMVEDGNLEILKLLSSTSAKIAQGEILQLQHNREIDMLEDYNSEINLFGKKPGNDFYEGKITLPMILLFQQSNELEKNQLKNFFKKNNRTKEEFSNILSLISKYKIISQCYKKAEHFIDLAANSLTIFENTKEKKILENLTSFCLERSF